MCVIYNNNNYYYIYIYIYIYNTHTQMMHEWICAVWRSGDLYLNHETMHYGLSPVGWWFYGFMVYTIQFCWGWSPSMGNLSGNLEIYTDLTSNSFFYKGWGFWRHFLDASLLHCSNFLRMTSLLEVLKGYPGAPTRPD